MMTIDLGKKPMIIMHRHELQDLAKALNVRPDWHEPDEQDVSAKVSGFVLDNACVPDPRDNVGEMVVIIYRDNQEIASVNLATLLGWASQE